MNHRKLWLAVAALCAGMALSGCAGGITAVNPGPMAAGSAYTLSLGRQWSDISAIMPNRPANVRLLTIDGPLLNRLYVANDIVPGAGLMRPPNRQTSVPVYRADMTSRELVELITETVAGFEYLNVEPDALAPVVFAGRNGVAFTFTAQTKEGLQISGRAVAAARDDRLQAVIYHAPSEHYYARYQAEVDRIFDSVVQRPPAPPAATPAPAPAPAS